MLGRSMTHAKDRKINWRGKTHRVLDYERMAQGATFEVLCEPTSRNARVS